MNVYLRKYFLLYSTGVLCLFCYACKQSKPDKLLFELKNDTGISFSNEVTDSKDFNIFTFRNFYNGAGVAIGDINNDGLPDIFFTANMGSNKLYLNRGDFKFEDISVQAGFTEKKKWATGVVMADINNDGWLDLYVCYSGHMNDGIGKENELYINNQNLGFTESARSYGLADSGYSTQSSFFDYDLDGDLDCFIINNTPIPVNKLAYDGMRDVPTANWNIPEYLKGGGDHLYRNDNGKFKEVTHETGIHGGLFSLGLGVTVGDFNDDNYPDMYVSNDFFERDYLYINQKNGTFKDEMEQRLGHASVAAMGADLGDINNDGQPEIFTTDMLPEDDYRLKTLGSFDNIDFYRAKLKGGFYHQYMKNCLQLNNGKGKFSDIADYCGVSATDWSWGALMFDADNDGWNDLYVCNGINRDLTNLDFMDYFANGAVQTMAEKGDRDWVDKVLEKMPKNPLLNKGFKNSGDLKFTDAGKSWGFTQPSISNGSAYADLDNDGDLDLVVNNTNQKAFIYKNNARELNKNNYISVVLKGLGKNSFAIGSKIKAYAGKKIFYRELVPSRGFQSSVDYKTIIGLGSLDKIDSIVVEWPDLTYSKIENPAINKTISFVETVGDKKNIPFYDSTKQSETATMTLVVNSFEKHKEDDHVDFYYERNIPQMLSREGPRATVGDVNGDGTDDVFIGGAAGQSGQLYLQNNKGVFARKEETTFSAFADFEDVATLFFDADNDKDPDLLVCSGGNATQFNLRLLQHRLYKNDGKGNFTLDTYAFPESNMNIGVVAANDFDQDGDLDLFVGGRNVPGVYGLNATSYLYVNDGKGRFTDMAKTKNPDIASIGMVTGAVWVDITGDQQTELVIVGEWMTPRVFSFVKDHFEEVKTNLADVFGWWKTVSAADLNGDGKADLVLGNIGENFCLRPDAQHPVKLWVNDYDQNGAVDKIITRFVDEKDKPFFLKRDFEEQIPSLKKKNLRHDEYAKKSIQDLISPELLGKGLQKKFNFAASCVLINDGNGQFSIQKLPVRVQMSSINAVQCIDINGDGFLDIVSGGNEFGFLPQFERLDASKGDILINNGKGVFSWMSPEQSGLCINGEIRDIRNILVNKKRTLLFLQNDDYPVLYRVNGSGK